MKIMVFFIIALSFAVLYGVPERFDRLFLLGPDGALSKTVDLIGDGHDVFLELEKVPDVGEEGFVRGNGQQVLANAERAFMQMIQEMAQEKRAQPIDVLWEISADQYQFNGESKNFLTGSFIEVAGKQLQQEFQEKPSSLNIIDADTYRTDALLYVFDPDLQNDAKIYSKKVAVAGKDFFALFKPDSKVFVDLQKLETKNPAVYGKVKKMWDEISTNLKKYLDEYIEPYLTEKPEITLLGLQRRIKSEKKLDDEKLIELLDDFDDAHAKLMDLEIIIEIFLSDAEHIIVYAGSFHTSNVVELLVQDFGFKRAFTVGYKFDDFSTMDPSKMFQLDARAWDFLRRSPQESFSLYQKNGFLNKTAGDDYYQELENILARKGEERLNALKQWLGKGSEYYLNAAGTRIEYDKPLLAKAVELNDVALAKMLLEHGANITALYLDEKKKEYVSVFDLAHELKNKEMLALLSGKLAPEPSVEIPLDELQRLLVALEFELQVLRQLK